MKTAELLEILTDIARTFPRRREHRWYLFGSALRDAGRAGDFDLAIVCPQEDAISVRKHLDPWCAKWPLHLTILTPVEEALLEFTAGQGAVQFHPPAERRD